MLDITNPITRLKWSSIGSYGMAAGKLIVAILSFSVFLLINAFYTAIIGYGKHQSILGLSIDKKHSELWYYKRIGWLIIIASLIYMIYATRLFITQQNISYEEIPAITIATITFSEIGVSVHGIVKAHKSNDLMRKAVKLLNLSSALISLVLTQTALLSISSDQAYPMANAISGFFFGTITLLIGGKMVLKKQLPVENQSQIESKLEVNEKK